MGKSLYKINSLPTVQQWVRQAQCHAFRIAAAISQCTHLPMAVFASARSFAARHKTIRSMHYCSTGRLTRFHCHGSHPFSARHLAKTDPSYEIWGLSWCAARAAGILLLLLAFCLRELGADRDCMHRPRSTPAMKFGASLGAWHTAGLCLITFRIDWGATWACMHACMHAYTHCFTNTC